MTLDLDMLLEGAPSYQVVDLKDGVVLCRREGHEAAFDAVAAQVLEAQDDRLEVIPLMNADDQCDRLFVAPLNEERSFDPR